MVEKCETLKSLPKSNKKVAILAMRDELGILKDALGELEEARSNGFMESFDEEEGLGEQWKEDDLMVLNPSLGLIKTTVALVKKTIATVEKSGLEEGEMVEEFDRLMPRMAAFRFVISPTFLLNAFYAVLYLLPILAFMKCYFSPLVDDLALSLYPPINWSESKANANQLKQELELCLSHLRPLHFMTSEEAAAWAEFIGRAVTHNFSEIQRVFVTRGLAEIRVTDPGEDDRGAQP